MPVRYEAEQRANAKARKAVFVEPPTRRNRIWQMDFSDFETSTGGNWQIGPIVDYVTKYALTIQVTGTQTGRDAVSALAAAIEEAERLLGHPLINDCTDPETKEVHPLVIVTDNGPAFKSDQFIRFIAGHPELVHVRTRYRAPQTNGVAERFIRSLKYEHLYRQEIATGHDLAEECERYRDLYNQVRPHQSLAYATPEQAHTKPPAGPPTPVKNFRRTPLGGLQQIPAEELVELAGGAELVVSEQPAPVSSQP